MQVSTCFLFTQHLNENGCLSLSLKEGEIAAPLSQRSFNDIKILQANTSQTLIVVPSHYCGFYQVELPWLGERKARAAIPFALEDKLARNIDSLHFAFDRHHYQNGEYLVVVGDKIYLQEIITKLDAQALKFDKLTVDWFALKTHEVASMPDYLLTHTEAFKGALSEELIPLFLAKWASTEQRLYRFSDSADILVKAPLNTEEIQEHSHVWLAKRLQTTNALNLCQGELQHHSSHASTKRWYKTAIVMSLIWLMTVITVNVTQFYTLHKKMGDIDAKIAAIYHEFFPQSQQVLSPKFRISQLLKTQENPFDFSFWQLLDKLAKAFNPNLGIIEQLRFQNQTLFITLATKDFASLEELQSHLQQMQVKVKQTQASTRNKQVVSTLELNL